MPTAASESTGRLRISPSLICDALVFIANLVLAGPILKLLRQGVQGFDGNDPDSKLLGGIIGGALAAYTLGCWLLRGPLHRNMRERPQEAAGCLLVAWFSLMLSLTIFGAIVVTVEISGESDSGWFMVFIFAVALLPVIFGLHTMMRGDIRDLPAWRTGFAARLMASILIIGAILPVTLLWQEWISGLFTQNLAGSGWGMRVFACGMAMAGFAVFYWAPRLVLVWESMRDKWTWATFGLAALPVIKACLFP